MYSLKCDYYEKQFNYLHDLVDDVMMSGMDPNYEITNVSFVITFIFCLYLYLNIRILF